MPDTTIEYSIIDNGGHGTVSVVLDGLHVLASGHANYAAVIALLTGSDLSEPAVQTRLKALLVGKAPAAASTDAAQDDNDGGPDNTESVELSERVALGQETGLVVDGTVEVTNSLTQKIVDLVDSGANESRWAPLVRLLEKQVDADDHGLYPWAIDNGAAINDDGSVVGYVRTLRHPSGACGVEMDLVDGKYVAKVNGPDDVDTDLVTTVLVGPTGIVDTADDYLLASSVTVVAVDEPLADDLDEDEIAHLRPGQDQYGIAAQLTRLLDANQE